MAQSSFRCHGAELADPVCISHLPVSLFAAASVAAVAAAIVALGTLFTGPPPSWFPFPLYVLDGLLTERGFAAEPERSFLPATSASGKGDSCLSPLPLPQL
jgi:hypothetical protein